MKRIITILIIVGIIALIAFRLISNKQTIEANKQIADNGADYVTVNTATVTSGISKKDFNLLGTITPDQSVDIKAETAGKVDKLYVELGDNLHTGAPIARIDNSLLQIAYSKSQQDFADAERNYKRYQNLFDGGAASQSQLDQYQLQYENAASSLAQAKRELQKAYVNAPFNGTITKKSIDEGAYATIGASLVTLIDVKNLKVKLSVAEKDAYSIAEGDSVSITASVFPGVTYSGLITFISPQGDDAHNYDVEVAFRNHKDHTLKSGTYVNVKFSRSSATEVLQIPRGALVGSIQNARVYRVENGVAVLQKVTLGADNGDFLEVSSGLNAGDQVVTTGQINLTDSTKVKVIE